MQKRQRRRLSGDFADRPAPRVRTPPKPWREVLKETPDPEKMSYADAMARLITLRWTYDDEGVPLVDPDYYRDLVKAAYAGELLVVQKLRTAIYTALARLEQPEPDLEPVEF